MSNESFRLFAADSVEVIVATGNELGEGPIWDPRKNCLYWLDILNSEFHRYIPQSQNHTVINVGAMAGSIHLTRDEELVVLTMCDGLCELDLRTQQLQILGKPFELKKGIRFNDGKTDAAGRLWAGTMEMGCTEDAGEFLRVDSRDRAEIVLTPMTIPNGLAWKNDNSVLYHIDSPHLAVSAYPFDLDNGLLGSPTTVLSFQDDGSIPDGMCIDDDGMLWIAFFGGGCVNRYDPESGVHLARVELPAQQITSCCFGGEDRHELFITSSRYRLDGSALAETPLAGALFKVRVDVTGPAEPYADV